MKKTLQDQYLSIKEGKGHKGVFLTEAKRQFPNIVRNAATFEEAVASLQTKNIITENVVGLTVVAGYEPKKKESYELAYEAFLVEAKKKENEDEKVKAEEKKPSKKVEEDASRNFDRKDDKNPDNLIFDQIMTGYYAEMKDPKNADKTMQELKDMVFKNLAKDTIYYTKDGQFGEKGLGYVTEVPGLGTPKEAKGKFKSSGYGDLNEGIFDMFKSKPLGDVEGAKKQALDSFRAWVGRNAGIADPESLSDDQVIEKIKAFAKNNPSNMVHQLWNQTKHLFEGESLEESKLRKVIREMIAEELNTEEFKDVLIKLEQPHLNDKEALGDIQKIYSSHIQGLNSISQNLGENTFKKGDKVTYLGHPGEITGVNKEMTGDITYNVAYDKGNGQTKATNIYLKSDAIKSLKEGNHNAEDFKPYVVKDRNNPNYVKEDLRESVEKELAEINKEAEHEIIASKLEKVQALIDRKQSQLTKLDEDEDMKNLTDKKKVKEIEKDVKALEKAKAKLEKIMSKKGGKAKKVEVIDEVEDELEASAEYLAAKEDAENRYDEGEEIDSILSNYPNLSLEERNMLRIDLEGKMNGMDY